MAIQLTPGLQVESEAKISKRRELPVLGEILVKVGDKVSGSDLVAKAFLPGEMRILRAPERMGLNPREVMESLRIKVGDEIKEGDLLCEHIGLFGLLKSRLVAPYSGTVELITERTAHIGVRFAPRPIHRKSYIEGTVIEVNEGKSCTVETEAAFIQGIFGVGGERRGQLTSLGIGTNKEVTTENIPDDCTDLILFGGKSVSHEVLNLASKRGAVGFITASIEDKDLKDYLGYDLGLAITGDEDISMTLIITEGFGSMEMADRTFNLLSALNGRGASINGATQVRAGAIRPEIIVPYTEEQSVRPVKKERDIAYEEGLKVGQSIRIVRVPYFGMRAKLIELPRRKEKIESGTKARVLRAELENGDVVTVPRVNVEIV